MELRWQRKLLQALKPSSLARPGAKSFSTARPKLEFHYQHSTAHLKCENPYDYTSGRWLYNEAQRLSERHLRFDVQELAKVAARSIDRSEDDVLSIRKLGEGGFNRIFEVTMTDESQVLARLPYPSTKPKRLAVASEVATMDLVRAHGVPVPQIFGYSTEPTHPVGAEYILMKKVHGQLLNYTWFDLTQDQCIRLTDEVAKIEAKLLAIELPAYGSIYHQRDVTDHAHTPFTTPVRPDANLCIGPDVSLRCCRKERSELDLDRGPHTSSVTVMLAVAEKEIEWLRRFGKPRLPVERLYREFTDFQPSDPKQHIKTLEKYIKICPYLVPDYPAVNRPTIRHPDLQPSNIFVNKNMEIVGLIDWQHTNVLPLFLKAGIPYDFQNYGDDESERLIEPKLPTDLSEMTDIARLKALEEFRRRQLHYGYVRATAHHNPLHAAAIQWDPTLSRRKLYETAGASWDANNIPLKAQLIELVRLWPVCSVPPPISFDKAEVEKCLRIQQLQGEASATMEKLRMGLGIGTTGWTSLERFDGSVAAAAELKAQVQEAAESDVEKEVVARHWPFDERSEED